MASTEPLPSITIVTPSFQQARFLERTIQSIIGQNYPRLEYLIFDGGSTDGSVEIIKKYADRINFWVSEKDDGQSDAINKGLSRATGEIVGWINSDDTMAPGSLEAIGTYYRAHQDAEFLYGHLNLIDADDHIIRRLFAVQTNAHELIYFNRNLFSQPGTTWRRRLQERIGLLDRSLHYTMDCDLYIRAAKATPLHFIPRRLANLRIHGDTKTKLMKPRFDAEHKLLDERYGARSTNRIVKQFFNLRRRMRILRCLANWK